MRRRFRWSLVVAAALAPALAWGADEKAGTTASAPQARPEKAPSAGAAAPAASEARAPERPARVRASHRVDVIAPGERVETIIDRMRAERVAPPGPGARSPSAQPVRAPERHREMDRLPSGAPPGQPGSVSPSSPPGGSRPGRGG